MFSSSRVTATGGHRTSWITSPQSDKPQSDKPRSGGFSLPCGLHLLDFTEIPDYIIVGGSSMVPFFFFYLLFILALFCFSIQEALHGISQCNTPWSCCINVALRTHLRAACGSWSLWVHFNWEVITGEQMQMYISPLFYMVTLKGDQVKQLKHDWGKEA